MSLQARFLNYTPLYNPNRDVAHNFKFVMQRVAAGLEDETWPELASLLRQNKVSMEQVGEACAAYCRYLNMAITAPKVSVFDALEQSGFFACPPMAQVAVMATLGQVFSGIQHVGVREATLQGDGPVMNMGELVEAGEQVLKFYQRPVWLRWLRRWLRAVLRKWRSA
jgi:hypothetical protein